MAVTIFIIPLYIVMLFLFFLGVQFVWLTVYLIVMSGLYISPLFIESPCVKVIKDIPHKPNIIGHRGAPAVSLL